MPDHHRRDVRIAAAGQAFGQWRLIIRDIILMIREPEWLALEKKATANIATVDDHKVGFSDATSRAGRIRMIVKRLRQAEAIPTARPQSSIERLDCRHARLRESFDMHWRFLTLSCSESNLVPQPASFE